MTIVAFSKLLIWIQMFTLLHPSASHDCLTLRAHTHTAAMFRVPGTSEALRLHFD